MDDAKSPAMGAAGEAGEAGEAGGAIASVFATDNEREALLRTLQGHAQLTKNRARRNRLWAIALGGVAMLVVLVAAVFLSKAYTEDSRAAGARWAAEDEFEQKKKSPSGPSTEEQAAVVDARFMEELARRALVQAVFEMIVALFFAGLLGALTIAIITRERAAEVEARNLEVQADLMTKPAGAAGSDGAPVFAGDKERAAVLHTLQGRVELTKMRARRNRLWAIALGGVAMLVVMVAAGFLFKAYFAHNSASAAFTEKKTEFEKQKRSSSGPTPEEQEAFEAAKFFAEWVTKEALDQAAYEMLVALFFAGAIGVLTIALVSRQREAELEARDLEVEADLMSFAIPPRQVRAERLFRRNEYELLKYYTLNLRQSRAILAVGVGCILAGLGVVALTFWAVMHGARPGDSGAAVWMQAIVGVVGAVSAVLVNFVAAVYLKMHGENATALSAFHERLVGSNNLFLANLLVSRIDAPADREKTLAEMALTLSKK